MQLNSKQIIVLVILFIFIIFFMFVLREQSIKMAQTRF